MLCILIQTYKLFEGGRKHKNKTESHRKVLLEFPICDELEDKTKMQKWSINNEEKNALYGFTLF